jgi:hypothetical protein
MAGKDSLAERPCVTGTYFAGTTLQRPAHMDTDTARFWHVTVVGLVETLRDLDDPSLQGEARCRKVREVQPYLDRLIAIKRRVEHPATPEALMPDRSVLVR